LDRVHLERESDVNANKNHIWVEEPGERIEEILFTKTAH